MVLGLPGGGSHKWLPPCVSEARGSRTGHRPPEWMCVCTPAPRCVQPGKDSQPGWVPRLLPPHPASELPPTVLGGAGPSLTPPHSPVSSQPHPELQGGATPFKMCTSGWVSRVWATCCTARLTPDQNSLPWTTGPDQFPTSPPPALPPVPSSQRWHISEYHPP